MLKDLIIFSTFVKLLLFPTYRSTDFEVHRNWLAITHSLPISKWYYEDRSEWTLDYPPFFAWFEWILSQFAPLADKEMLRVDNLNYTSDATIYFQRATVIISELVLFYALKKGLCHAYWAPNFWALYSAMDRVLIVFAKRLGWTLNESAIGSITRGLVGDVNFALLPQVKANHTFILTLIFQMASLVKLWKRPSYKNFLVSLILNGYSSFLFGWHVHEKAILLVMIPFSLISADNIALFRSYMILAVSGLYSLFPLLFKLTESTIKIVICLLWFILTFMGILSNLNYKRNNIKKYSQSNESKLSYLIKIIENIYMYGFIILQFFTGIVHQIIYKDGKYPFLPLLSTSIYCAFGVIYSWIRLSVIYFLGKDDENQEVNS
ncbi:14580_t:CDS:2 [Rhizophagus irregularis]|nr:14580_t:CDS:2 [Rhizophagus irregularis]